jgi:hypothetical protein
MGRHWSRQEIITHTLEATRSAPVSRTRAAALRTTGDAILRAQRTRVGHRARAALARTVATVRRHPRREGNA